MNLEKLKDTARKFEQKEDWRRAIEVYLKAIQQIESGQETSPDLSLYNRVGDLYLKTNDTPAAVRSYERAVDLYADQGFFNNAIALCGKILRVNPGRTQTYLKLAQLHARKNVVIEAKRNLIEFMERMNALGQLDLAFGSVREFADQFSGSQDIRLMLIELLRAASREEEASEQLEKLAGEIEGRGDRPAPRPQPEHSSNQAEDAPRLKRPPAGLVFLDTGVDLGSVAPDAAEPAAASGVEPAAGLILSMPIDPEAAGQLTDEERMAVVPGLEQTTEIELESDGMDVDLGLERVETTDLEFIGEPLETMDEPADDILGEALLDTTDDDLIISSLPAEGDVAEGSAEVDLDLLEPGPELEDEPVTAESFGAESAGAQLSDAEPTDTELTDAELTDAELAGAEPVDAESVAAAALGDLPLLPVEPAGTPSVVELESLILDDPDNPDLHLRLADRLVDGGEEVRGLEELELALAGYERRGDGQRASELAERLTILAPDTVRHHQKRVELAFRSGERAPLLAAYLALGDSLARSGATDKALAVFGRVQEHDPGNAHALSALAALRGETQPAGEVEPESRAGLAPPAAPATPSPAVPEASGAQPPGPSVEAPRTQGASPPRRGESDSFVDLGSMILDEGGVRDTRMRVDRADPKGKDEQREFQEILEQFKRGIEQNLDSEDYEAHYDLGVAFKEMGLLDEAIAEFQKALRSPDGRLRTSEALGICFYDKGQYGISETVLRRAVETVDGGDEAKIGLLYWLGRAAEAQGKEMDAITSYERALAVDIRFMDLSDRMHRLAADRQK